MNGSAATYLRVRRACCPISALSEWELDQHAADVVATITRAREARELAHKRIAAERRRIKDGR